MNNFESLIINRRSIRKFTSEPLSPDDVHKILQSALLSPSSKNSKSWEFIAIDNPVTIKQLSECKDSGSSFLEGCAFAVVVTGNRTITECWIENASIAAILMQLQAEDLGIGSCWCQVRNRFAGERESEQIVRDLLEIPHEYGVLCIIGFGHKEQERKPSDLSELTWEKVHIDTFGGNPDEIFQA
jgi:nitroreductase